MADVQIENGYTKIANELIDQFQRIKLSGNQWNILMVIIRQTYGYNRKEWEISNKHISEVTGIHRCHVSRELSALQDYGLITIEVASEKRVLKINKDYEHWDFTKKNVTKSGNTNKLPKTVTNVTEIGNKKLPKMVTNVTEIGNHTYKRKHKDNIKENIKYTENFKNDNSAVTKMKNTDFSAEFENLWKLYPRRIGKSKVSKKAMKELEKAGFDTVKKAIENYKAEIQKFHTQEQYIMHGSTFFNGGWKDYTESEVNGDADPYANVGTNL